MAILIRGCKSKAVMFCREDLPADPAEWDAKAETDNLAVYRTARRLFDGTVFCRNGKK